MVLSVRVFSILGYMLWPALFAYADHEYGVTALWLTTISLLPVVYRFLLAFSEEPRINSAVKPGEGGFEKFDGPVA